MIRMTERFMGGCSDKNGMAVLLYTLRYRAFIATLTAATIATIALARVLA